MLQELREPREDSRYQVEAIKTGSALIADRILLRHISWDDLDKLGFCGDTHEISEGDTKMKKYFCNPCGYTYDPEKGDPEHGIAPGTAFEDIPDDWCCPLCGVSKSMFQPCIDNYN